MQSPSLELRDSVVRAGAGAGKTTGLVDKVLSVYRQSRAQGLPPPRIVLTTFTRKATQELKERLIRRACEEKDAELLQFVSDPSHLYIATIHGLLNTFLKTVGHLAGLDSGFQIINSGEATHLARLAMRQVLVSHPEGLNWLETYSFDRVLEMCRRYDLMAREAGGLEPASVADLQVLADRMRQLWRDNLLQMSAEILSQADDKKWVTYAHDIKNFAELWSQGKMTRKELARKPTVGKLEHLEELNEQVEATLKSFKKEADDPCWNEELWQRMTEAWTKFQPFAQDFSKALAELKEAQGRFEMADLELKALEILREKPFVASVFSEAWDFWMIDEYQDTSPVQVSILAALIGNKPKYYVGDPQQSIYLFRGAEVRVFTEAEGQMKQVGGDLIELLKNYRSVPELLLWINDFMASLSQEFMRMQPRDLPGAVQAPVAHLVRAQDGAGEMRGLACRVADLVDQGVRLDQICVLGRTHRGLMEASRTLKGFGYPTHVHSSRGFNLRREVLDAQALWKFLVNPHDNLNLMALLRSPWFFVADWQLTEWMTDRPRSLWRKVSVLDPVDPAIARLKQAQQSLAVNGLARTFEDILCASGQLDLSLANDPAGRKESNLWKLVSRARSLEKEGGSSILNLLGGENEDPLDANEGDATSAQEPNCINLMTIHGSKGLQFEHILMAGVGESPRSSSTPTLQSTDGKFFFPIWSDSGDGEKPFVSSPLDIVAVNQRRRRELEEFDRWLYVAVTRAKQSVSLFWSDIGRDSWAQRSPWFTKPAGRYQEKSYLYEIADAPVEDPKPYADSNSSASEPRVPWQDLSVISEGDVRNSVTELIDKTLSPPMKSTDLMKRWQAQALGTSLHKQFEALKYHQPTGQGESDQALNFVLGLKSPPMKTLIKNGHSEWGFQVRTEGRVVEGQIDLWGKHEGTIYIVDYKTGSAAFKESAFQQLSIYAWALRRFGHQEPIELVVIYPLTEKVESRPFQSSHSGPPTDFLR